MTVWVRSRGVSVWPKPPGAAPVGEASGGDTVVGAAVEGIAGADTVVGGSVGVNTAADGGGNTDGTPVEGGEATRGGGGEDTGAVALGVPIIASGAVAGGIAAALPGASSTPIGEPAIAVRGDTNAVSAVFVPFRRVVRKSAYAVVVAFWSPGTALASEGPTLHAASTERMPICAMSIEKRRFLRMASFPVVG